jgi:hypothetical protein
MYNERGEERDKVEEFAKALVSELLYVYREGRGERCYANNKRNLEKKLERRDGEAEAGGAPLPTPSGSTTPTTSRQR